VPVVVPTQFVLDGDRILLHLAGPNPVFDVLAEQPRVMLSVAGDWAYIPSAWNATADEDPALGIPTAGDWVYIPSAWKATADEDPALGIPTTYYAAVQIEGVATVETEPSAVAAVLRTQLAALQPDVPIADPELAHPTRLRAIRAITISMDAVRAKFKYGGNVDRDHRQAVIEKLRSRNGPGDHAAADHTARRSVRSDPTDS
jgi:transcriptional regulator